VKRSTVAWIVAAAGFAFLLLLVCAVALVFSPRGGAPSFALGGRVGVVDIEGIILSADRFRDTLAKFKTAPGVKAVVVRINSPGGGVAASQELFSEIRRFRKETGKPVVVSMESVAASGGYYAAVAADHIVANPGTITGSIGVIMQWMNYGDLLEWAKVRAVTLKSGALKDAGNPSRPLTDEERKYFEDLIQGRKRSRWGSSTRSATTATRSTGPPASRTSPCPRRSGIRGRRDPDSSSS